MKKFYISFGQGHRHEVDGKIFDKDCLAEIKAETHAQAREIAVELFGLVFCTSYEEEKINEEFLSYFPDGIVEAN